jgi:hypothetical protein
MSTAHPAADDLVVDSGGGAFHDGGAGLEVAGCAPSAHTAPLGGSAERRGGQRALVLDNSLDPVDPIPGAHRPKVPKGGSR